MIGLHDHNLPPTSAPTPSGVTKYLVCILGSMTTSTIFSLRTGIGTDRYMNGSNVTDCVCNQDRTRQHKRVGVESRGSFFIVDTLCMYVCILRYKRKQRQGRRAKRVVVLESRMLCTLLLATTTATVIVQLEWAGRQATINIPSYRTPYIGSPS